MVNLFSIAVGYYFATTGYPYSIGGDDHGKAEEVGTAGEPGDDSRSEARAASVVDDQLAARPREVLGVDSSDGF